MPALGRCARIHRLVGYYWRIPLLLRRGGCASKKMNPFRYGADGVVAQDEHSPESTTPYAPLVEAARCFLDVASSPPHEEGNGSKPRLQVPRPCWWLESNRKRRLQKS